MTKPTLKEIIDKPYPTRPEDWDFFWRHDRAQLIDWLRRAVPFIKAHELCFERMRREDDKRGTPATDLLKEMGEE